MSTKKMSYVVALEKVLAGEAVGGEVRERLEALKASQIKRNTHKTGVPTKAQKERAELAEKVFEAMEPERVYTSAELAVIIPELAELHEGKGASAQKITAIMKSLGERIVSEKDKGKAVYHIA